MAKKRTWPPCVKCGKAQGTRKGGLCSRCEKESLNARATPAAAERRKVADLRPHPRNAGIYSDGPDDTFVDSVKRNGVLTALLITTDNLIIAGHKRWRAAELAGRDDVPVIVLPGLDEDRILELLIESNLQRSKTNEQLGNEADALWPLYQRRRGRPIAENPETGFGISTGDTRDAVGKAIGVSGLTAERVRDVILHLRELDAAGDSRSYELRDELARSVKGGWELMRSWQRPGMPPAAPDLPDHPAADGDDAPADPAPQSKEDGNVALGADGEWPQQPFTKEDRDDLAGPDLERPDAEAQPDPSAAPAPKPQAVRLDPFGVPLYVQVGAAEAFATAEAMAELADELESIGKRFIRLARQCGSELLRQRMKPGTSRGEAGLSYRSVDIDNARLALTQTMPASCRCPECHSRGLTANARDCGLCQGRPYVTAHQLAGVDRRKIEAMARDLAVPGKEVA